MEEYVVIAKLIPGTNDKFEDYRILKKEEEVLQDYEIVLGPASLEDCGEYLKLRGREKENYSNTPNWFALTIAQYALIGSVTVTFVVVIVIGAVRLQDFRPTDAVDLIVTADDSARVLITFLVAVATVAIAFLAILTAMMLREYKERFALAKEVLTILVGILGTIVGFYFGTAANTKPNVNANPTANASKNTVVNSNANVNTSVSTDSSANANRTPQTAANAANNS